jgi:hypothetical protein
MKHVKAALPKHGSVLGITVTRNVHVYNRQAFFWEAR